MHDVIERIFTLRRQKARNHARGKRLRRRQRLRRGSDRAFDQRRWGFCGIRSGNSRAIEELIHGDVSFVLLLLYYSNGLMPLLSCLESRLSRKLAGPH
jgi:hypothetical protein